MNDQTRPQSADQRPQDFRSGFPLGIAWAVLAWVLGLLPLRGQELLPTHITPDHVRALERGLEWLKRNQSSDGSWSGTSDGAFYPIAMAGLGGMAFLASGSTSSRGPYADQVRKTLRFALRSTTGTGLISSANEDNGRPMFGHGFMLLFLATLYGMENDQAVRDEMAPKIRKALRLTARGQSNLGGWLYYPGGGDEGSVTITQMQALRACHNAGFTVPSKTVELAIKYLEKCKTPEGGIRYSFASHPSTQMPITAAAVATLYNAGAYDSDLAKTCLEVVRKEFRQLKSFEGGQIGGHAYYSHLYAAQAFYQAGDDVFAEYFPKATGFLLKLQKPDGSWEGDGIGAVFGTSVACIILQLPYKFLPIYQR